MLGGGGGLELRLFHQSDYSPHVKFRHDHLQCKLMSFSARTAYLRGRKRVEVWVRVIEEVRTTIKWVIQTGVTLFRTEMRLNLRETVKS